MAGMHEAKSEWWESIAHSYEYIVNAE